MVSIIKSIQSVIDLSKEKSLNCLSMGNSKLPKFVGIFSLLAGVDCGNAEDCHHSCYAMQAQTMYKATYAKRNRNSIMAHKDLSFLKEKLIEEINKKKPKVIRIHESGDFISDEYVRMWIDIAKYCYKLGIPLYSYTKMYDIISSIKELNDLANVNIINSLIEGHRNYGSQEYCEFLSSEFGAIICPDRHDGQCMVSCRACIACKRICFPIHGNRRFKDTYEKDKVLQK